MRLVVTTHKAKKDKLVRDSFTIPKVEYAVIDELKQRAAKLNSPIKKSELLRAGIKILASLSNAALLTALAQVPTIKTGRPSLKNKQRPVAKDLKGSLLWTSGRGITASPGEKPASPRRSIPGCKLRPAPGLRAA